MTLKQMFDAEMQKTRETLLQLGAERKWTMKRTATLIQFARAIAKHFFNAGVVAAGTRSIQTTAKKQGGNGK